MELQNQPGTTVKNGTAKETSSKASQNGEAKKTNEALLPNEVTANPSNGKAEAEQAKPHPVKVEAKPTPPEPAKIGAAATEAPKAPEEVKAKPVLNLASTLKVVEDLHRRSIQRVNLISRIRQLETFEIQLAAEHDELEENPYQGCRLIIEDDKRRQFVTTTPGLIRLVSQFIFNACNEKLAEIEAHIVLPIL